MWQPVIKDKTLLSKINSKLEEINTYVCHSDDEAPGFFSGQAGQALFLSYYNKFSETTGNDLFIEKKLQSVFDSLASVNDSSMSAGFSGINWVLQHLIANGFIDLDDELFQATEGAIKKDFKRLISEKNYDFMHGLYGCLFYFSEIGRKLDFGEELTLFTNQVRRDFNTDDGRFGLEGLLNWDGTMGYSLGLSHGVPSFILVLLKLAESGLVDKENFLDLAWKNCEFLLSFENEPPAPAFFPNSIINKVKKNSGSLAWCYGDLGCAMSIYKLGLAKSDAALMSKAINIALSKTTTRLRQAPGESIMDADFCHGTVGVAHVFSRFYNYTGLEEFRAAAEYWYRETLQLDLWPDGACGYKHLHQLPDSYVNMPGVLEGVAGIGLSFISALRPIEPKWDSAFLLS